MASRLELHEHLLMLTPNVYFQPPVSSKMNYPAIRYSRSFESIHADDDPYHHYVKYEIIVIDRNPESQIVDEVLKMSTINHIRHYVSDGLNHDVFTIYW